MRLFVFRAGLVTLAAALTWWVADWLVVSDRERIEAQVRGWIAAFNEKRFGAIRNAFAPRVTIRGVEGDPHEATPAQIEKAARDLATRMAPAHLALKSMEVEFGVEAVVVRWKARLTMRMPELSGQTAELPMRGTLTLLRVEIEEWLIDSVTVEAKGQGALMP